MCSLGFLEDVYKFCVEYLFEIWYAVNFSPGVFVKLSWNTLYVSRNINFQNGVFESVFRVRR